MKYIIIRNRNGLGLGIKTYNKFRQIFNLLNWFLIIINSNLAIKSFNLIYKGIREGMSNMITRKVGLNRIIKILMMLCIIRSQRLVKRYRTKIQVEKVGIRSRRKKCLLFIVIFRKWVNKISKVGRLNGMKQLLILWTIICKIWEYFQKAVYKIIFILLIKLAKKLFPDIQILEISGMN
jgi:hypothetical protein